MALTVGWQQVCSAHGQSSQEGEESRYPAIYAGHVR
jgi:hypothetical protein